jgi:hypothetical protein
MIITVRTTTDTVGYRRKVVHTRRSLPRIRGCTESAVELEILAVNSVVSDARIHQSVHGVHD